MGKKRILHINGVPMWTDDVYVSRSKKSAKWGLFANRNFGISSTNWMLQFSGDLLRENKVTEKTLKNGHYIRFSCEIVYEQIITGFAYPYVGMNVSPFQSGKTIPLERIAGFASHYEKEKDNPGDVNTLVREAYSPGWGVLDIEFYSINMYSVREIKKDEEIIWEYSDDYYYYCCQLAKDIPRDD